METFKKLHASNFTYACKHVNVYFPRLVKYTFIYIEPDRQANANEANKPTCGTEHETSRLKGQTYMHRNRYMSQRVHTPKFGEQENTYNYISKVS